MLYWAESQQALQLGAWWWFVPPGLAVALIGTALVLLNTGIDELGNPRLRDAARASRIAGKRAAAHRPDPRAARDLAALARAGSCTRSRALASRAASLTRQTPPLAGELRSKPILEISDLSVAYRTAGGDVRAVDQVNLTLHAGEVVGLSARAVGQVDPRLRRQPAAAAAGADHRRQRALPRQADHPGRQPGRHPRSMSTGRAAGSCAGGRSPSCSRAR